MKKPTTNNRIEKQIYGIIYDMKDIKSKEINKTSRRIRKEVIDNLQIKSDKR